MQKPLLRLYQFECQLQPSYSLTVSHQLQDHRQAGQPENPQRTQIKANNKIERKNCQEINDPMKTKKLKPVYVY